MTHKSDIVKIRNSQTTPLILGEIGRRLAAERLQRGVPQAELAAAAGLSRQTIVRMESGESCRLDAFVAVLKQLGFAERLEVVLPEPGLTPIQEARLAAAKASPPKRARKRRAATETGNSVRRWGDGVSIGGGGRNGGAP